MNTVVWKFTLNYRDGDHHHLMVPIGAEVLSAHAQGDDLQVWALIDTDAQRETREFVLVGTGYPTHLPRDRMRFINTVQLHNGRMVLHVFEVLK